MRTLLFSIDLIWEGIWCPLVTIEKNGVKYGIHGGDVSMMFLAIVSPLIDGMGYSAISAGNSYIQAVTWDETDCPIAYGALTYSQSSNPLISPTARSIILRAIELICLIAPWTKKRVKSTAYRSPSKGRIW